MEIVPHIYVMYIFRQGGELINIVQLRKINRTVFGYKLKQAKQG